MKHSQLFNQTWSIMIRNRSLWVVTLLGLALSTVVGLLLNTPNLVTGLIRTIVSFITNAFISAALISMINSIAEGQPVTLNTGLQAGVQRMPRLIAIQLILTLPIWLVLFLATGSFLTVFTSSLGQPGGVQPTDILAVAGSIIGVVGLIIVIGIITGAISIGADRAVVLEGKPVFESLRRGWQLFSSHLRDFIVIGLMMFVVILGIGLLFGCATSALLSATLSAQLTTPGTFNPTTFLSNPAVLISAVFGLVIGTITQILYSGVWTLAFRKWQEEVASQ